MHHVPLGPQAVEGETVAAARLLDQGCDAQRAENSIEGPAHVILDGQHETGRQLPERGAGPREGRAVGKETPLRQEVVEHLRRRRCVAAVLLLHLRNVVCHPVEHARRRLQARAVVVTAQIALLQNLDAVLAQVDPGVADVLWALQMHPLAFDVFNHGVHAGLRGRFHILVGGGRGGVGLRHALAPVVLCQ